MNRQTFALACVLGLTAGCDADRGGGWEPQIDTIDYSPAWSPDFETIAFVRIQASQYGPPGVYAIRADGTGRRLLLELKGLCVSEGLRFSYAGDKLCYSDGCNLFVLHIGIGEDLVATGECNTFSPDLSPDGQTLAHQRSDRRTGLRGLYLLDLESPVTGPLLQAGTLLPGTCPRRSPAGDWIAYAMHGEILLVRPDGSASRRLTKATAEGASPGIPHGSGPIASSTGCGRVPPRSPRAA